MRKDVQFHMSQGKCKLKQWDATTHLLEWPQIQNTDDTKCWWGWGATGTLILCYWECKMIEPLWKTLPKWNWRFLTKLNIFLPDGPAIVPIGIYTKELKIHVHIKTCSQVFTEALFIIAQTWKQPGCPLVGELWSIQTMECYSVLKRSELSPMQDMEEP